jgi:hypothetical protein
MTFTDSARLTVDTIFNKFGRAASYQLNSGEQRGVLIIWRMPDRVMDVADSFVKSGTDLFEIRVSEIENPLAGELIYLDHFQFKVYGEPMLDQHGLVWKLEAYRQDV